MASILKNQQTTVPAPTPNDPLQSPITTVAETISSRRAGSARIIKTIPVGEAAERTPAAASARAAGSKVAAGGVGENLASHGMAGKISGVTLGKNAAGSTGLVEFNLSDLAEQGREQIQRCREQVEAMMEQARSQAEQLKQDAKAQGLAAGKQAAERQIEERINQEAQAKAEAQVASLHQAVVQMKQQYDAWMQQYAETLTGTALAVAERLTRAQMVLPNFADDEDAAPARGSSGSLAEGQGVQPPEHLIVRWAREALHSTRSASRLTLAVHPDTLAHLGKALDELLAHPDLPEQSVVIPDENLKVGDIIVRQDGGEISAGLDAQLARLREELM